MKKIFRLMMSVVAMSAIVGCATDATEDLSVKVGGKTQLTLSLDNSRTQLGEKADGVYPLTWSEGDQISVNGVASEPLATEDGAGTANAVFTFGGALQTPYCVAYPAADAGQVKFADTQYYNTNNSFESGVATMFGYSANGENIELKHLTGILKLCITAADEEVDITNMVKLSQVRISTIDRKPIAGTFDFNFETGKLTPTKESTAVITYVLDKEPLRPGMPVNLHIAVPAGVYDELYVTVVDINGNMMQKTVKAYYNGEDNDKSLKAGKVREFNELPFVADDATNTFVISDYDSLVTFTEAISKATEAAPVTKNAVFVNDVTIPETGWTSIDAPYYTGLIDGKGFAIRNLNAPLFGNLAASVKGLHLENVGIELTLDADSDRLSIGALACKLTGSDAVIDHCSVSGSMTVTGNNPSAAVACAGFFGNVSATSTISNVENNIDITVGGTFGNTLNVSGVVPQLYAASTINNATNNGSITINSDTSIGNNFNIGGIAGYCDAKLTANHLTNNGKLSIGKTTITKYLRVGGVVAYPYKSAIIEYATNNGAVEITDVTAKGANDTRKWSFVGGVLGYSYSKTSLKNATNYGSITINSSIEGTKNSSFKHCLYVGGIWGFLNADDSVAQNLLNENSGTITIKDCELEQNLTFAGVLGQSYNKLTASTLENKAAMTLVNISVAGSYCNIGGVYGYNSDSTTVMSDLSNSGTITVDGLTAVKVIDLGGVVGILTGKTTLTGNITNIGNIVCHNVTNQTADYDVGIGGIIGRGHSNCHFVLTDAILSNSGDVSVFGGSCISLSVAGIYGDVVKDAAAITNATNTGDIIVATNANVCYAAGIVAGSSAASATVTNSKCFGLVAGLKWDGTADGAVSKLSDNVGMITSAEYDSSNLSLTNCGLGGWWGTSGTVATDEDGKLVVNVDKTASTTKKVKESDFKTYLYSTTATEANDCYYWNGK